jgi:hypothetical protein
LSDRCSHIPTCELYPLFGQKSTLRVWQVRYCEGDYQRCARYTLAGQGQPVPTNLLPNGKTLGGK